MSKKIRKDKADELSFLFIFHYHLISHLAPMPAIFIRPNFPLLWPLGHRPLYPQLPLPHHFTLVTNQPPLSLLPPSLLPAASPTIPSPPSLDLVPEIYLSLEPSIPPSLPFLLYVRRVSLYVFSRLRFSTVVSSESHAGRT